MSTRTGLLVAGLGIVVLIVVAVLAYPRLFGSTAYGNGVRAYNEQDFERAVTCFERALAARPGDATVMDMLRRAQGRCAAKAGLACCDRKDYEGAARELEKATELLPGDPSVRRHLADAYAWHFGQQAITHVRNGDLDKAAEAATTALDRLTACSVGDDALRQARWWQAMLGALRCWLAEDDKAGVVALTEALRDADGGEPTREMATPEYWRVLFPQEAAVLFAADKTEVDPASVLDPATCRLYATAVQRVGYGAVTRMLLAMTHRRLGQRAYAQAQYAEAIAAFDSARRYWPEWSEIQYDLGFAYYKNQDYASAVLRFLDAKRLAPNDPRFTQAWEQAKSQALGELKTQVDDALTQGAKRLDVILKRLAERRKP